MGQSIRRTAAAFKELHHRFQIQHAIAGRARRCPCCLDNLPASEFVGSALVCAVCQDGIDESMSTFSCDDGAPYVDGWCPRGCQHLEGLGECGICGYEGNGVPLDEPEPEAPSVPPGWDRIEEDNPMLDREFAVLAWLLADDGSAMAQGTRQ